MSIATIPKSESWRELVRVFELYAADRKFAARALWSRLDTGFRARVLQFSLDAHEAAVVASYLAPVRMESPYGTFVLSDAVLRQFREILPKITIDGGVS